jgi:hypothetical protein
MPIICMMPLNASARTVGVRTQVKQVTVPKKWSMNIGKPPSGKCGCSG